MTGYTIRLRFDIIRQKTMPSVIFGGDCVIDTTGYDVDETVLNELRTACDEYNTVSDSEYPDNATGKEIHAIDEMLESKIYKVNELSAKLAKSAKVQNAR